MPRKSSPGPDQLPPLPAESGSYVLEGGEWVLAVTAAAEPQPPVTPEADGTELS
jgi:hypothetical protein